MKNTLLLRGKPLNRLQWDMRPTEINAYYSPNNNKIGGLIIMNCYKLIGNDASWMISDERQAWDILLIH